MLAFLYPSSLGQLWRYNHSTQSLRRPPLTEFVLIPVDLSNEHVYHAQRDLSPLNWWFFSTMVQPHSALKPFAPSLRKLCLRDTIMPVQDLASLLALFPYLEHLHLDTTRMWFNPRTAKLLVPGLRTATLTRLAFEDKSWDRLGMFLPLFSYCPKIEHITVNICHSQIFFEGIQHAVLNIQNTVCAWRAREAGKPFHPLPYEVVDDAFEPYKGLETLDVNLHDNSVPRPTLHTLLRFQSGCQDLVAISACVWQEPRMVVSLMKPFMRTVRQVDLETGSNVRACSSFETLGYLLGSLPGLQRLKFDSMNRMTKEQSMATFQGQFWEDQGSAAAVASTPARPWACQGDLERLEIRGLWRTWDRGHPVKGNVDIVLRTASKKHRWVAHGAVEIGNKFREIISEWLELLPVLRKLTLGTVMATINSGSIEKFEYMELNLDQSLTS
ncbi:hypothetical protein BG003_004647 [Podila horticola]|nr:hypothetical protein BG003_004647 [Podila horticola]